MTDGNVVCGPRRSGSAPCTLRLRAAIAALKEYGGTVFKTSLSDEDTAKLQEALAPKQPADV